MTNEELMEIGLTAYGKELRKGERKGYRPYVNAVITAILPEIERLRAENEKLRAENEKMREMWDETLLRAIPVAAALKETKDE